MCERVQLAVGTSMSGFILIWKEFFTPMYDVAVCEGRTPFSSWDISWKLWRLLIMVSTGWTPFSGLFLFDDASSNTCKTSINHSSVNELVFGDFNVRHKCWLSPTLRRVSHSLFFWIYLYLLNIVSVLHRKILIILLSYFPLVFRQTQKRMFFFHCKTFNN